MCDLYIGQLLATRFLIPPLSQNNRCQAELYFDTDEGHVVLCNQALDYGETICRTCQINRPFQDPAEDMEEAWGW